MRSLLHRITLRLLPLGSKRRWRVAYWLDQRSPHWCWTDLVAWVLYENDWDEGLRDCKVDQMCFTADRPPSCYCGKRTAVQELKFAAEGAAAHDWIMAERERRLA